MSRMLNDYPRRIVRRRDWVEFFGNCALLVFFAVAGALLAVALAQ